MKRRNTSIVLFRDTILHSAWTDEFVCLFLFTLASGKSEGRVMIL